MNSHVQSMYETLIEAGFHSDVARKMEHHFDGAMEAWQEKIRAEMRDSLITKADLKNEILELRTEMAQMESRLLKASSDQLRWIVGTLIAVSGLTVTLIKLL
jgi:predicted  nucleic acid-binding Zn-ribbon protein